MKRVASNAEHAPLRYSMKVETSTMEGGMAYYIPMGNLSRTINSGGMLPPGEDA